jgi:hypothetical protein
MASPRRDLAIAALTIVSLAANAFLFVRWRARPAPAQVAAAAPLAEAWRRPWPGLQTPPPPVALEGCQQRAAWLEAQLAELDGLRARHLPARQRFTEAPPNAELTAALAAALAGRAPAKGEPGAECRGRLCRLAIPASAQDAPWVKDLRESEWLGENLHLVEADAGGMLFEQHRPGSLRSSDLLQQALQDFESSGAVEQCQARFRGEGTLDAELSLEPWEDAPEAENGGVVVQSGGRLAGTELGRCIDAEFRRALAALTLPPRYDRAALSARFPRP